MLPYIYQLAANLVCLLFGVWQEAHSGFIFTVLKPSGPPVYPFLLKTVGAIKPKQ